MKIIQLIIKRVSDEKIKTAKQLRTPFLDQLIPTITALLS